jgi:hypothetical protein
MRSGGGSAAADSGPPDGGSAGISNPALRLRYLVLVLVIMAVFTIGWPLLNRAVSNRHPLATLTTLTVGPGPGETADFTIGPGWSLLPADSDPRLTYSLSRGPLDMDVSYVALASPGESTGLWTGLRDIVRLDHPGVTVGQPSPITTAQGRRGMTSTLRGAGLSGTATIIAQPARKYAIELIMLAPTYVVQANLSATRIIIHSVRFPTATR